MTNMEPKAAIEAVQAIYADPKLSKHQKHLRSLPIAKALSTRRDEARKELAKCDGQIRHTNKLIAALRDMAEAWNVPLTETPSDDGMEVRVRQESTALGLDIQKNDCSRLHKLADAIKSRELLIAQEDTEIPQIPDQCMAITVSHDWAALVHEADGEVNLPAPVCAFEYRFSGRTTIVVCSQEHEDREIDGIVCYETKAGDWLLLGMSHDTGWMKHVRAACIVLDAEVATHEVQRAPHKLNEKRVKAGKTPLYDFHVIELSRRSRASRGASASTGHRKRLHFCRGHWRHYETSKTWIRWCLKGDPDLGWVDKEYRL